MVAHFTMRTYGVNQEFRFDEGIWLHRKSGQIRFFFGKYLFLHHACATCSEQPSYIKTMNTGVLCGCPSLLFKLPLVHQHHELKLSLFSWGISST